MEEITAYLNDDTLLDEVAIEQTEVTVMVEASGPVLATTAFAAVTARAVAAGYATSRVAG